MDKTELMYVCFGSEALSAGEGMQCAPTFRAQDTLVFSS